MAPCETLCNKVHGLKPTLIMILVQAILAIVTIGIKLASNDGMSLPILVAYRLMFGAAFIVPIALFLERKKRPKLTWTVALYGFLCGLFGGVMGQNLYLQSLALTSATFASAMTNLMPAMTFIVAICLGLEKLGWKTSAGKAKVVGTLMGIGGAMLLTFFKGPVLNVWDTNINLLELTTTTHDHHTSRQGRQNLALGTLLALGSCAAYSVWLIIQAKAAQIYPCPYSITAMMTVWGSLLSVAFAICTERDWSQWKLGWNIRLLTVAVAGIVGSGIMFSFMAWCVKMRGPLFVSVFNPLLLVMVAVAGSLFLDEKLYLGMLLGGVLIVGGLYMVLWGKRREIKRVSQLMPETTPQEMRTCDEPSERGAGGSSRGGRKTDDESSDQSRRDSHASSEVLGGLYLYP